ncbi:MAG TPA: hypothetical protein VMW24_14120 [Sedimentisphaerales bacterium]|nr:hypothetical protein [Sedimentisphaerales bacterium]
MRRSADTLGWPWRAKKPAGATQEDHTTATHFPFLLDPTRCPNFARRAVKPPVVACVEQVYEEGNFAGMGIGT